MSNLCATKKTSSETSKARLLPKRGEVKVRIFRMVVKKVAGIASTVGLGGKRSRVADNKQALASPLEISVCSLAEQQ